MVLQTLSEDLCACRFPTNEDLVSGQYPVALNRALRQVHSAVSVMVNYLQECARAHSLEHEAEGRESDSEVKLADQAGGNGGRQTVE